MCHTTYITPSDGLDGNMMPEGILFVHEMEAIGIKRLTYNLTEQCLYTPYQHYQFKPILLPDGSIQCEAPVKEQDYETMVGTIYMNSDKEIHSDNLTVLHHVKSGIHLYYPIARMFDMERWVKSDIAATRNEMNLQLCEPLVVDELISGCNDADPDSVTYYDLQTLVLAGDPDEILAASQDAFSVASFRFPTPEHLKEIVNDILALPNFSKTDTEEEMEISFSEYIAEYEKFYKAIKPWAEQNATAQDERNILANEGALETDTPEQPNPVDIQNPGDPADLFINI